MARRERDAQRAAPDPAVASPEDRARLRAGTVEHYADPGLYDHEYRRRRADVNHYRRLVAALPPSPRPGRDVLELGCGSGRLLVPLLRDGARVTGIDLSQPMLRRCRERIDRLRPEVKARATVLRSDFRSFSLGRRFAMVLCPFNAMMHLYSADDLARFFSTVRAHLAPSGRFCFDVLVPDLEWLNRDPSRRWARTRMKDPRTGRGYFYSENHVYDPATQIAWIRLYYDDTEPPHPTRGALAIPRGRVVQLAHRQLYPEELRLLLAHHGFAVEAREGGFHGEPFGPDSESQVYRCTLA